MPMNEQFTYDVFLSHNAQDKARVRRLAERLRAAGLRVWFDEWVIQPGDVIQVAIDRGLDASRTLVLCLSPAALASDWVRLEHSTALFRDPLNTARRFIPLLLADCTLPDTLRRYKYVDYRDESEAAFAQVLASCRLQEQDTSTTPQPARFADNVLNFSIPEKKRKTSQRSKKDVAPSINQTAQGDGNVQHIHIENLYAANHSVSPKNRSPKPGSIGANSLLKQAIKDRFDKLGEEREKRFGQSAYAVVAQKFKKDFGIKIKESWMIIWEWPEGAARTIIEYLDKKYEDTKAGRIERAIERGSLIPSKGHLFKRERELLNQIGLEISSPQVKEDLEKYFGVDSHTKLDQITHWKWVLHLEDLVRKKIGE